VTAALRWLGVDAYAVHPYDGATFPRAVPAEGMKHAAIVDVETIGLADTDPVIEVAALVVAYDPTTGALLGRREEYQAFSDPGVPIPPRITELTGITNDDVRGQRIDERFHTLVNLADLVISHNAGFDRPRVDRLVSSGTRRPWACSCSMIDWRGHGLPSASLGALCLAHGFYTQAHRAMCDVVALAHLLSMSNAETGRTYFAELLAEARRPAVEVFAWRAPFEAKDALKSRGYRWRDRDKVWSRVVPADSDEMEWLATVTPWGKAVPVDPKTRFAA
jgi:DNA polymerase-3 subunit epsilon